MIITRNVGTILGRNFVVDKQPLFTLFASFFLLLFCCGRYTLFFVNSFDNYADTEDERQYALCDEYQLESLTQCKAKNRICLFEVINQETKCGPCSGDYIKFGTYHNEDRTTGSCVKIDTMEWLNYFDDFNPVYSEREDRIVPDDQRRLPVLKEAAKFIVEMNLRNRNTDLVHNNDNINSTTTIASLLSPSPSTGTDTNGINSGGGTILWDLYLDYELGLTPYTADFTEEDYRSRSGYVYENLTGTDDDLKPFNASEYYYPKKLNNTRSLQEGLFNGGLTSSDMNTNTVPDRVDWVELGGVTHVKDQGRCGCCWAISLNGAIEGGVYSDPSNYGYLQSLSFQQLISCSKTNGGCDGGNLALASLYTQIGLFKGITRLNDYPYTDYFGKTTTECLAPANVFSTTSSGGSSSSDGTTTEISLAVQVKDAGKVAGFEARLTHDQRVKAFKEAIAVQPVAMVMKSSCRTLSNYRRGVLADDGDCACDRVDCVDHAILMVGYDDKAEIPYFKMKISWGTRWGENGYFRVAQTPADFGTYGLFGILADGVVASGRNTTAVLEDKIQMNPIRQWWVILLIVVGSVFMFGVFYTIFRTYFCRPKDN